MSQSDPLQTPVQHAVLKVLERLCAQIAGDEPLAEQLADALEDTLSDMHSNDAFGTEGQCDPRGDFRNGEWDMYDVEDGLETLDSDMQNNVLTVLTRITAQVRNDEDEAEMYADEFEGMLNKLRVDDAFGAEGERDPRGDFRNGAWSMAVVEGVPA